MSIKQVLLVGSTGHLGRHFVPALRAKGKDVRMLVRPETAKGGGEKRALLDGMVKQGATIVEGNMEDKASLEKACAGVQAVISCTNMPAQQPALVDAAKKAGVKRFVPSEFGFDPLAATAGTVALLDWKRELQGAFKASGIPCTYVYSNGFATYWASGLGQLGLMSPPDELSVYGDGNVKVAMVMPADIATYTVAMLDDPRTENKEVAITPKDNTVSQNELVALWESKSGKKVKKNMVPGAGLDAHIASLAGKPDKMMEMIFTQLTRCAWIHGVASKRRAGVLEATELYPDIRYTKVSDFLDYFLKK